MTLIIAEKPSLARNIVAGIEQMTKQKMTRRDGYFEGCGYLVSWAFGHLFSLCDIEAYLPPEQASGRWSMEPLPCFPQQFRYELRKDANKKVDPGVKKQFSLLCTLCNRADVDAIANAGDADREGEIIVRLCISNALKPENVARRRQLRLWLPDQTPETVAKALAEMKDEAEYDNLASEGFARTYIDWLYGVNLTRYATLRMGTLLRVGRVIVPIVRAIYERDMAIKSFVPGKYYVPVSRAETDGEVVELTSKQKFDEDKLPEAQALCDRYNTLPAVVTAVKNKKDKLQPGKLYSLSKLQNVLGKKYKMSMADSLEIVQKLYEQGYLTYPRTNSEYLATAEKDKIKQILSNVQKMGYPVAFKDSKTIFDDTKIETHSALTPTYKIPNKNQLSEREMQVYSTVFRRFVAVFCAEDCIVSRTEITITLGEEEVFTLKGMTLLESGWTKYDDFSQKDKILPKLKKGDIVNTDFKPAEKETSPPRHYTIETLNNYLKNPFKEEKAAGSEALADRVGEDDAEEYRAMLDGVELGTEATRTGIIDNARRSKYIDLKKDVYTILPDGIFLIESLEQMRISMDKYKTSDMGRALKRVFRGEMAVEDSVALAKAEIAAVFDQYRSAEGQADDIGFFGDVIGACPLCGKEIKRFRSFYGCTGYKDGCKFSINTTICRRSIGVTHVRELLERGQTDVIHDFISPKSGKHFDAALKLDENGRAVFVFDNAPRHAAPTGNQGSTAGNAPRYTSRRAAPPQDENPFPPAFYDGE